MITISPKNGNVIIESFKEKASNEAKFIKKDETNLAIKLAKVIAIDDKLSKEIDVKVGDTILVHTNTIHATSYNNDVIEFVKSSAIIFADRV